MQMSDTHIPTLHTASQPRQVTDRNNNLNWEIHLNYTSLQLLSHKTSAQMFP